MKPLLALLGKLLHETRWMLGISSLALFALGWLFVFVTSMNETEILKALASEGGDARFRWMRSLGMAEQPPTVAIMMAFWGHPFIILTLAIWAIGRGSVAVGAEIERGTLDLVLSRPVSRTTYLGSQVGMAVAGLLALSFALALGAAVGVRYNVLRQPPSWPQLVQPALNLAALGLAIYGYTLLASSLDHVRWRSTMFGSIATMAGFIAYVISVIPALQKYEWRLWLQRFSIFKLYNPVDAVSEGNLLLTNMAILAGIGLAGIIPAFLVFARRDLPASG